MSHCAYCGQSHDLTACPPLQQPVAIGPPDVTSPTGTSRGPRRCPCCNGWGQRASTDGVHVVMVCPSCHGAGITWAP